MQSQQTSSLPGACINYIKGANFTARPNSTNCTQAQLIIARTAVILQTVTKLLLGKFFQQYRNFAFGLNLLVSQFL